MDRHATSKTFKNDETSHKWLISRKGGRCPNDKLPGTYVFYWLKARKEHFMMDLVTCIVCYIYMAIFCVCSVLCLDPPPIG